MDKSFVNLSRDSHINTSQPWTVDISTSQNPEHRTTVTNRQCTYQDFFFLWQQTYQELTFVKLLPSRINFCSTVCLICIAFPVNSFFFKLHKGGIGFAMVCILVDTDLVMNCTIRSSKIFIPQYLWPFQDWEGIILINAVMFMLKLFFTHVRFIRMIYMR